MNNDILWFLQTVDVVVHLFYVYKCFTHFNVPMFFCTFTLYKFYIPE